MVSIGIIGVGSIAGAFIKGLTSRPYASPYQLHLVGRNESHNAVLEKKWHLPAQDLTTAWQSNEIIIISTKPDQLPALLDQINNQPSAQGIHQGIVISFVNGASLARLEQQLNAFPNLPIIRAMPNTSMQIHQGITGISPNVRVNPEQLNVVRNLFSNVGEVYVIPEKLQASFTALAGSGPAYFYYLTEALIDAGVLVGIPRELAQEISRELIIGSAAMLAQPSAQPSSLRADITSPGGSTAHAIAKLEYHGLRNACNDAICAAKARIEQF